LENDEYNCKLSEKLLDDVSFLVEAIIQCPKIGNGYQKVGHGKERYTPKRKIINVMD
tara:strand:+ start:151 stop:321 length:171 start_codon:yes stop_codon:yes gene_type:complete